MGSVCLPARGEGRSAALASGLCWPPSRGSAPAGQPAAAALALAEPSLLEHAVAEPAVPQRLALEGLSAQTQSHQPCLDCSSLLND